MRRQRSGPVEAKLIWAALLLGFSAPARADPPPLPQQAPEAVTTSMVDPLTAIDLGVDYADRMTLPVHIAGAGPYPFIIDTGSQRTILSTELAQKLALASSGQVRIVSMSGPAMIESVQVPHLRFGSEELAQFNALMISRANLGGVGLIGLDGLHDKRVTMDFKVREMRVSESKGAGRVRTSDDEESVVVRARSRLGQLILVDSHVDGTRVQVILDTGAQISIGNMALFRKLKADRLLIPPRPEELTSVTGESIMAQYTVVRRINVGGVELKNVPMVFVDAAPFAELRLSKRPAMLLGMAMLQMFDRIAIDFGRREVNFVMPRSSDDRRERLFASR